MKKQITVGNPVGDFDAPIVITFHPTKSIILSVIPSWGRAERISELMWQLPPTRLRSLQLEVKYRGEPPSVFRVGGVGDIQIAPLSTLVEQRRDAVKAAMFTGEQIMAAEYFRHLDERVTEMGLDVLLSEGTVTQQQRDERIAARLPCQEKLYKRMSLRRAAFSPSMTVPDDNDIAQKAHVSVADADVLAEAQLDALEVGFAQDDQGNPTDWRDRQDDVERAYELFAMGALALPQGPGLNWGGEPNSAQMFMFAEFAFMRIHMAQSDKEDWARLANVFVRVQEVFRCSYCCGCEGGAPTCQEQCPIGKPPICKACPPPLDYAQYHPPARQQPVSEGTVQSLRQTYTHSKWWNDQVHRDQNMSWLKKRMGRNLVLSFKDTLAG